MLVLVALGALALPACGEDGGAASGGLEGVSWELTSLAGFEGAEADAPVTARFENGSVTGNGGCNQYHASYELDGGDLTIGPVAGTRMACGPAADAKESAYFAALALVSSYQAEGGSLSLLDADGDDLLAYREVQPASLTGTAWSGIYYNDGDALVSAVAGSEFTATFSEDGTVQGTTGCNTYSGPYTVDGEAMEIGPLASTQMACAEDPMAQEAGYLGALDRTTSFAIEGDELTLLDSDGVVQVSFRA